jgi:hypothetical protein
MNRQLAHISLPSVMQDKHLATRTIAERLGSILPHHIGRKNAISRDELFKKIFHRYPSDKSLADYVRYDFLKRAMHFLRQQTHCFVISHQMLGSYYFYVIDSQDDVDVYVNRLEQSIKQMRKMQRRAQQSFDDEWSSQDWKIKKVLE